MFITFDDIEFLNQFSSFSVEHNSGTSHLIRGIPVAAEQAQDPLNHVVAECFSKSNADVMAELMNHYVSNKKTK